MSNTAKDPLDDPIPPDELARLEERNRRWKEKHEAWRRMLERLDDLIKKSIDKNRSKPSST